MPYCYLVKVARNFCFCIVFVVCSVTAMGQCTIGGSVADSTRAPVPYAAVGLLSAKDSSLVKGTLCNDSGAYVFSNIKPGSYLIKIEATGYPEQYSTIIRAGSGKANVPLIKLQNTGNNLKGLKVVADKPFIEHQAGKIIFNVEGSVVSSGKNALEVLNDLPGVSADDDANISVHGKGGVLVLVDEKPVYMDLATYLKSIDASQIEKIEVIANPSAKYDASGKAVINIVLKKDKNLGLNGELSSNYRQSVYPGFYEGLNINYRTRKWNFFANTGLNILHDYSTQTVTETIESADGAPVMFNENAPMVTQGITDYATAGIDFMPDSRQTITLAVDGFSFLIPDKSVIYNTTIVHSQNTVADSSLYNPSVSSYTRRQYVYSVSYTFKIDTNGRELSANLGYLPYLSTKSIQNPIYYYNSAGGVLRPSTLSTAYEVANLNVWNLKIDYTHPFNKKSKLETGIEAQHALTNNDDAFYNVIQGVSVADSTRTNHFNFKEGISAGYVNYYRKLNAEFDFEAGVRVEQTNDNGIQYVHETSFTRNYLNLFPSASMNWKMNDANSFSLSYTRRIDRPSYLELNPFIVVLGPYNYSSGNINLLPQFYDNYELDYNLGNIISSALGFYHFTNVISSGIFQKMDTTLKIYNTSINVGSYNAYFLMVSSTLHPAKWWTSINTLYSYHDHYIGSLSGNAFNNSNLSFQFQCNNMFNFKHGWKAQLMFWYHSSNLNGVRLDSPMSDVDIGIGKHFDDDKFTINVSYTDVFATRVRTTTQNTPGLSIVENQYQDFRKIRLSLSWKFGKSQYHRQQENKQQNIPLKGGVQ